MGFGVVFIVTVLSSLRSGFVAGGVNTFIFNPPSERGIFLGLVVRWWLQ